MNQQTKNVLFILLCLGFMILSVYFFKAKEMEKIQFDEKEFIYNQKIDSLNKAYVIAKNDIDSLLKYTDSILSLNPKIKIKYKEKYEAIKTFNSDSITNEFKNILSKDSIH